MFPHFPYPGILPAKEEISQLQGRIQGDCSTRPPKKGKGVIISCVVVIPPPSLYLSPPPYLSQPVLPYSKGKSISNCFLVLVQLSANLLPNFAPPHPHSIFVSSQTLIHLNVWLNVLSMSSPECRLSLVSLSSLSLSLSFSLSFSLSPPLSATKTIHYFLYMNWSMFLVRASV